MGDAFLYDTGILQIELCHPKRSNGCLQIEFFRRDQNIISVFVKLGQINR